MNKIVESTRTRNGFIINIEKEVLSDDSAVHNVVLFQDGREILSNHEAVTIGEAIIISKELQTVLERCETEYTKS